MNITVFGTGHVGLVTSVCFAELGHSVVAVDRDREVVASLSDGVSTLYEPGLDDLLRSNLRTGRFRITTSAEIGLRHSTLVFLCVGTPAQDDGRADLSQIDDAVSSIAPHLTDYALIVEKSTVPVNTAQRIAGALRRSTNGRAPCEVASNPEFLREGAAIDDFLHPDRIVVGVDSGRARDLLLELYRDFACPILVTDVKTAELIKHAANAFLATKISFINMIADLCERVGADVSTVARGIGLDHRIGPHFLRAGLGFGGSCFRKDLQAFVETAGDAGVDFSLLREVGRINERRMDRLLEMLDRAVGGAANKTVGVLGVAFKANTDDVRDAPSLRVLPQLLQRGVRLRVYDPRATAKMAVRLPPERGLAYLGSAYEAAAGADALLVLTEWQEFRDLDWSRVRALMKTPVIIDGRNFLEPAVMSTLGLEYHGFGRGAGPGASWDLVVAGRRAQARPASSVPGASQSVAPMIAPEPDVLDREGSR